MNNNNNRYINDTNWKNYTRGILFSLIIFPVFPMGSKRISCNIAGLKEQGSDFNDFKELICLDN